MAYGDGLEFMVWDFMGQDLELWFMEGLWGKRLWDSTITDTGFCMIRYLHIHLPVYFDLSVHPETP